jgi:hypothetical protein
MKVFGWQSRKDQPLTSPFPVKDGFFFALRGGDVFAADNWKEPKWVSRSYWFVPLRFFLSYRRGSFGFYIGNAKVFGVDTDNQKEYIGLNPAKDIYVGSVAMQGFTWRFSRTVK